MRREDLAQPMPPAEQVELLLARIEQSAAFRTSPRHRALLRHLVDRTLADDTAALKESVIAVEVFGRPAGAFDPRVDSIVRVESRRLRARLSTYFRTEGSASPLHIELPVGSYVPSIADRSSAPPAHEATRRARDLVERGEHFLRQWLSKETMEQALDRFDAALRESPDYVPALVGAGRAWLNLATGLFRDPAVAAEHAAEALRRAVTLDETQAVAHALLGAIEHTFGHDWAAAQRSFTRAVRLAPNDAFVRGAYGCHLLNRGELQAAERELQLSRQLDPLYLTTRNHMFNLRVAQRRLDDAQAEMEAMRDVAPDTMANATKAGILALERGLFDEAIAHYRRALELADGHPFCQASLASALGATGRVDEADAVMRALTETHGDEVLSHYVRAVVAARCGRADEAFGQIQASIEAVEPPVIVLAVDPSFRTLHTDPRWAGALAALRTPRGV